MAFLIYFLGAALYIGIIHSYYSIYLARVFGKLGWSTSYVGEKILPGDVREAWKLMLYYDRASDCAVNVCDKPLECRRALALAQARGP
jgi:hypothetical protein